MYELLKKSCRSDLVGLVFVGKKVEKSSGERLSSSSLKGVSERGDSSGGVDNDAVAGTSSTCCDAVEKLRASTT